MIFSEACLRYFGCLASGTLADFYAELRALSPEDQQFFATELSLVLKTEVQP